MISNPSLRTHLCTALASFALFALVPFVDDDDNNNNDSGDDSSGQSQLLPPMNPPDADAFGKVEVEKEGSEQEFKVVAERLPDTSPPGPFEVWLEDNLGSQTFFKVADMTLVSPLGGKWQLKLETKNSAPPELNVSDVTELAGRTCEVRDTGGANVYLSGIIVVGDDDDCDKTGPAKKGTLDLQRPNPAPDADAQGEVEMSRKGGKQELEVKAKNLDGGTAAPYSVQLETALGSDAFSPIGVLQPKPGKPGRYELELEGHCGPPATLGISNIADLIGRKIQVRDAADQVVLQGKCPDLLKGAGQLNFNKKSKLVQPAVDPPSPKATGSIRVKFNAPQGQSELEVETKNLKNGNSYSLWMEDAVASGVFVKVGDIGEKGHGKGKGPGKSGKHGEFEANTKKGGGLPFGVATVAELKSRLVEIRDQTDVAHLLGQVP